MTLVAFIDGSCVGNPGESGCSMVLKDEQNNVIEAAGWYLGHGTNNTAEYQGLIHCIKRANYYGVKYLSVFSDSQLLVSQIMGNYRITKSHLRCLQQEVVKLLKENRIQLEISYIPREQNLKADGLARKAIRLQSDIQEIFIQTPGHSG